MIYHSFDNMDILVTTTKIEARIKFDNFFFPYEFELDEFKDMIMQRHGEFNGQIIREEIEELIFLQIEQN